MDNGKIRERSYRYTNNKHNVINLHAGRRVGYRGDIMSLMKNYLLYNSIISNLRMCQMV